MYVFMRNKHSFIGIVSIFLFGYTDVVSVESLSTKGFRGAFVIPLVKKNGTTYVLLGRESGGKDKGAYCIPGGSSGWWIFRDTDPLKTAAREFIEETLTDLDYYTIQTAIQSYSKGCFVDILHDKKIVSYVVPFKENVIDDIIQNFYARRRATWFWQYYYREMDYFSLVALDTLIAACKNYDHDQQCIVKGLVYNNDSQRYNDSDMIIRPILRLIVMEHAQDLKNCT